MNKEDRALKQTILDLHKETQRKLDDIQDDISQIKRDVKTLARGAGYERDTKDQLRKAS